MGFKILFQQYINILQKHEKELKDKVKLDLNQLKDIKWTINENKKDNTVEYIPGRIRLSLPKKIKPNHSIPRNLSKDISITIDIEDQIIFKKTINLIEDPFIKLSTLNLTLRSGEFVSSWHLDRHTEEGIPNLFHPYYHLTFGGKHMENLEIEEENFFGNSLIIRSPRISHPPMDLILGIDFVLKNYFPLKELDILSDFNYLTIIKKFKEIFWKPYILSLTKDYCKDMIIDGEEVKFNDKFVNTVNGIYN